MFHSVIEFRLFCFYFINFVFISNRMMLLSTHYSRNNSLYCAYLVHRVPRFPLILLKLPFTCSNFEVFIILLKAKDFYFQACQTLAMEELKTRMLLELLRDCVHQLNQLKYISKFNCLYLASFFSMALYKHRILFFF